MEEPGILAVSNVSLIVSDRSDEDPFVEDPVIQFPLPFVISVHILYNLVGWLGLFGNALVCYVVMFSPKMKTVTNCFLLNLALGDLLVVTLCLPFGYLELLYQYWPFGEVMCYVSAPARAVAVFVSNYTLIALTVDRYMTIVNPFKPRLRRRHSLFIVVIIWIAAIITAVPIGIFTRLDIHNESGLPRCGEYGWESDSDEMSEMTYNLVLMILQYLFPVVVLGYCYSRICLVVWGKQAEIRNSYVMSPDSSLTSGKRKTVIMSLLLTLGYAVAWLPYIIIYIITTHFPENTTSESFPYFFFGCHYLAMSHSIYNPIIYVWINSRFRMAFKEVLLARCYLKSRHRINSYLWTSSWKSSSTTRTPNPDVDKNSIRKLMNECNSKSDAHKPELKRLSKDINVNFS